MSDIVDRIDELVNEQLRQESSGYDHNINQDKCPHCGRAWHGLRLTERIAYMYEIGHYDEGYSAADDDTPVVCEGSDFIGPMRYPAKDLASAESWLSGWFPSVPCRPWVVHIGPDPDPPLVIWRTVECTCGQAYSVCLPTAGINRMTIVCRGCEQTLQVGNDDA